MTAAQTTEDAPKKGKGLLMVGVVVALAAGGAGFMLPTLVPQLFNAEAADGAQTPAKALTPEDLGFVEFGEVVVNLNMDRFNRYLKLSVTLEVSKDDLVDVQKKVDERRAVLRGWLISHVADKTMDEIRGAAGQNKLRREIHDQFNAILSNDGYDVVNDVYFEEFNVQ